MDRTECPCQSCGQRITFESSRAGETAICPSCEMDTVLHIPENATAPPPVHEEPAISPPPDIEQLYLKPPRGLVHHLPDFTIARTFLILAGIVLCFVAFGFSVASKSAVQEIAAGVFLLCAVLCFAVLPLLSGITYLARILIGIWYEVGSAAFHLRQILDHLRRK